MASDSRHVTWADDYFDASAQAGALQELRPATAMLIGLGTYEYFATAWPTLDNEYAKQIDTMPSTYFHPRWTRRNGTTRPWSELTP